MLFSEPDESIKGKWKNSLGAPFDWDDVLLPWNIY
jgi:hypothetical protein